MGWGGMGWGMGGSCLLTAVLLTACSIAGRPVAESEPVQGVLAGASVSQQTTCHLALGSPRAPVNRALALLEDEHGFHPDRALRIADRLDRHAARAGDPLAGDLGAGGGGVRSYAPAPECFDGASSQGLPAALGALVAGCCQARGIP